MAESDDFTYWGKNMVDFISNYLKNIDQQSVIPNVEPGYLRLVLPENAPEDPESWTDIFQDVEKHIIPGVNYQILLILYLKM